MPHLDGFNLPGSAKIKRLAGIPMIALTAFASPDMEQRIYEAGFTAYLDKPINSAGLVARIRRYLGRSSNSSTAA